MLHKLLATVTSTSATSTASINYAEKHDDMSISHLSGIKDGCFRDGFQIVRNDTTGTTSIIDGVEIIDISLFQAQMLIYNWIGFSCNYTKKEAHQNT